MRTKQLLASLLMLTAYFPAQAHDTDIYSDTSTTVPAEDMPLVMFTLDYHTSLGANVCNGNCPQGILDLYPGYLTTNPATSPISRFEYIRAVLKWVFEPLKGVKVGLMMPHANSCSGKITSGPTLSKCSNGGYVVMGFREFDASDSNGAKAKLVSALAALPVPHGNINHPYQGKEIFFELYRYLNNGAVYNGHLGYLDYDDTDKNTNLDTEKPAASWDPSIEDSTHKNYLSPVTSGCAKIFTVNLLFDQTPSGPDADSNKQIEAEMTGVSLSGTNSFPNVIRWMYENDVANWAGSVPRVAPTGKQNVISYFVVDPGKINATTSSYAGAGVGLTTGIDPYSLSDDPATLRKTLEDILRNILVTSATFVAPSVAVNVYNRSQVLDQVYIAMFQVDKYGYPLWPGNVKRYKLATNASGIAEVRDVNNDYAVDATDGRMKYESLSFWTIPSDLPAPATNSEKIVAGKDGREVARGGAGSKIPGFKLKCTSASDTDCLPRDGSVGITNPAGGTTVATSRKLFTEPSSYTYGTPANLLALNVDTSTAEELKEDFGVSAAGTCADNETHKGRACTLIKYARGLRYNSVTQQLETRGWLMGDVLHSRPLAINYGARPGYSATNPDIRIVTGSNSGFLHMFRNMKSGETTPTNANLEDGVEVWAFMPREVMPTVRYLLDNENTVAKHNHGVDGMPAVYVLDWNGNGNIESPDAGDKYDKVYVYFGLRRGGNAYYALDITNPDDPKMLWKIRKGDTGFETLGQSWSTPKVAMMLFDGNETSAPVLIFGGGYDTNKDNDAKHHNGVATRVGDGDEFGTALYIVNAATGALIKRLEHDDLKDSVPSDITVVDTDGNGLADRAYFGDTGGNLWRADLRCKHQNGTGCTSGARNWGGWKLTHLATLGRHDTSTVANDRRFFYPPAYVQMADSHGAYDAVIIGSGDRENPKDTTVVNWVYMYKDRATASGIITEDVKEHADFTNVSCGSISEVCDVNVNDVGWRLKLECPPNFSAVCGEKSLSQVIALERRAYFTTYIPRPTAAGSCTLNEGSGKIYTVAVSNARAVADKDGDGILTKGDRTDDLDSKGIPAQIVPINSGQYLRPDFKVEDSKQRLGFESFWYKKENYK